MKVYLDTSALNRPFDDQGQQRVRLEARAVQLVLERCGGGKWRHVASDMVIIEIEANQDSDKRRTVMTLLPAARDIIENSESILNRAGTLVDGGFRAADAVHVSAAEAHGAHVLLTCDDQLLRASRRAQLTVKV